MARKKPEGLEALVPKQEPVSIQHITLQDWYASFALIGASPMSTPKEAAKAAWDVAEAMMEERRARLEQQVE